jgi:hypothetical protein
MPRTMTAAMATALSAEVLYPALLCQMNFSNANVNVWSGLGNVVWNGNTYTGLGDFAGISTISEDSTVEAKNVTLELSGVPLNIISVEAQQDLYLAMYDLNILQPCQIWLALRYANGAIISDPILSYKGFMDKPDIDIQPETMSLSISLENILVDLNRPSERRYTADDQKMDMPYLTAKYGLSANTVDNAFNFVAGLQEDTVYWGVTPKSNNS